MNSQPHEPTKQELAAAQLWIDTMQKASAVHDCMIGLWVALGDGGYEGVAEARQVLTEAVVQLDSQLGTYLLEGPKLDAQQPQPQTPEDKT